MKAPPKEELHLHSKECEECGETKTLDKFYIVNGTLTPRCRPCHYKWAKERQRARKAGRRLNKKGKPVGAHPDDKVQSTALVGKKGKMTPAKRSYVSGITKSATEMIGSIRDSAYEMAEQIAKTHQVDKLSTKEAWQVASSLKTLNDIVLTNSIFLKSTVDLSSLTEEELAQLAEAMAYTKDKVVDAEVVNENTSTTSE